MQKTHWYDCKLGFFRSINANFGQSHHRSFLFAGQKMNCEVNGRNNSFLNRHIAARLFKHRM